MQTPGWTSSSWDIRVLSKVSSLHLGRTPFVQGTWPLIGRLVDGDLESDKISGSQMSNLEVWSRRRYGGGRSAAIDLMTRASILS